MQPFRNLLLASLAITLSGCYGPGSLKELRRTEPKGNAFHTALAKHYLEFSESEAAQYDWRSSKYFADKGLLAAYGREAPPELPANWDLPADAVSDIARARAQLLTALNPATMQTQPQRAADAQYYYDCWVEQQEEAWQSDDIAACKKGFEDSMKALGQMPAAEPAAKPSKEALAIESAQEPVVSTSYLVYFDSNETEDSPSVKKVIDSVIAQVKSWKEGYEIILNGHTDRSGSEEFNLELSQKRADMVKRALVKGGVAESAIQSFAFGESDPKVPTEDGVQEKANRRVEIFINQ